MPKKKIASLDLVDHEEYIYEDTLSVGVKETDSKSSLDLQHFFGPLLRDCVEIDRKHKYCSLCLKLKQIKRYQFSTATGNLRGHLRDKHGITLDNKTSEKNQRKVTEMLQSVGSTKTTSEVIKDSEQQKRFVLARQMCVWFCRDLVPFNQANKPGLNDFAIWYNIIGTDQKLPDRTTVADTALNDVYSSLLKYIKQFIKSELPTTLPLSMDFWTDNIKRVSFINYWVHWIDSSFEIRKLCLGLKRFPHPHTGKILSTEFSKLTANFELEKKTFIGVTDNGSNVILGCSLLNMEREPCICHNLHLLIGTDLIKKHTGLQPVRDLITKMKEINKCLIYRHDDLKSLADADHNKRIYHVLSTLENINELLEGDTVALSNFDVEDDDVEILTKFCNDQVRHASTYKTHKNSNVTRWNSVLSMFNSFIRNIDIINNCLAAMKNYDMILSDDDLSLASEFVKVLNVFEKSTDLLQGTSYPSQNLAVFCYMEIQSSLNDLLAEEKVSDIVKVSATFLLERLDARFKITENMVVATFLDPSMQQLKIISEHCQRNRVDMVSLLKKKWITYNPKMTVKNPEVASKEAATKRTPASKIRMEMIRKHAAMDFAEVDGFELQIQREYLKYTAVSDVVDDPLMWWKTHESAFPYLSALAKVMLSIPASSVSSESHFSESGHLINKKKALLDPLTIEKVMFIHDNFQYMSNTI